MDTRRWLSNGRPMTIMIQLDKLILSYDFSVKPIGRDNPENRIANRKYDLYRSLK